MINAAPAALQLRYLQTLREIGGGEQNSTIVFPLPIDLVKPLLEATTNTGAVSGAGARQRRAATNGAPSIGGAAASAQ